MQERVSAFPNKSDFKVTVDKFKDRTVVSTTGSVKGGKRGDVVRELNFRIYVVSNALGYGLFLHSSSKSWTFLRNHRLIMLADGERLDFGDGTHDGDVRMGGVTESIFFSVPPGKVEKIANAKTVELQLGNFEGTFDPKGLARIRQLTSLAITATK